MAYLNTHARTTSNADTFQPAGRTATLFGVFVGFVKDAQDVQRNGRLRVWIPEFGSAPENQEGWIIVNYCSPFAGATNVDTISKSDVQSFEGTQTSYGMWMVPPDINNQVLIMFINGDSSRGIWIGSLYNQFMNNMIPAVAADAKNWQYPGKQVPVAEYNKWDPKVTQPDRAFHPFEKTKFKGVGNQGLITDQGRGVTTSSARRESPSNVFGIITPGPVINADVPPEKFRRKGGSSFVMDDGDGSEYIQLATKSGAQIRIDETNGFVYIINRDGTGWIQIGQDGNIDVFGAKDISLRAQRDFNIRADRNVNIEAGQNIYMKAAKDTNESTIPFTFDINNKPVTKDIPYLKYVGEGAGTGGNIVTQALNNTHTTVKNNAYLTIGKNFELQVGSTIDINAGSSYNLTSPTITNVGAVKVRGTLQVTNTVNFGSSLGVAGDLNASAGSFSGDVTGKAGKFKTIPGVSGGGGATPNAGPGSAGPGVSVSVPPDVVKAEIKPLVQKANILATFADPESKFKRNAEAVQTTVSGFPTFEPCPEHETFTFKSTTGYTPIQTEGAKTYGGSGAPGNEHKESPPPNTDPGANNKEIPQPPATQSVVSKNFNMPAYECQLKIHEGVKYKSYLDSRSLPTAGIGHLLRKNEIPQYPVPTDVSAEQVTAWFNQDAPTSISGAQRLIGTGVWDDLTDIRKRACADLVYNMGEGGLAKFKRFLAAMKINDYDAAGVSLRDSLWFTQVGRRGPNIITMIVNNVDPNNCDKKFPA